MNSDTERAARAFHRVVSSITSTDIWRNGELSAGFSASFGPGVHVHSKDWPDIAQFRSLMMDFRQLVSNDDASSINRVCNLVFTHRKDGWSPEELEAIATSRRHFNEALDQPADFYSAPVGAPRPTVRRLLDGWMNGEWFHGDERKREERIQYELDADENLSLALIIPAIRVAVSAAIEIDQALTAGLQRL